MKDQMQKVVDCYNAGATVLRARSRGRWTRLKALIHVQRNVVAIARCCAEDDPASRRFDFLCAGERGLVRKMVERRHTTHVG